MKEYYCGPFWMPKVIRRALSSQFNASCKVHDLDYDSKIYTKQEADIRFLSNCIKQSRGRFFLEVYSCILFVMIRIGGEISWKKGYGKDSKKA